MFEEVVRLKIRININFSQSYMASILSWIFFFHLPHFCECGEPTGGCSPQRKKNHYLSDWFNVGSLWFYPLKQKQQRFAKKAKERQVRNTKNSWRFPNQSWRTLQESWILLSQSLERNPHFLRFIRLSLRWLYLKFSYSFKWISSCVLWPGVCTVYCDDVGVQVYQCFNIDWNWNWNEHVVHMK